MAQIRMASETEFTFQTPGYSGELRVAGFNGSEGISQLFHFDLELAVEDPAVDFAAIAGQAGTLTIHGDEGDRYVQGIISRFEQIGGGGRFTMYSADLVPTIWLLSHRRRSRIFQEMTVQEIIKKVLEGAGIPEDEFRFSLQGKYEPRVYCVQYRESELNFISRLMEEEGIFYYFEHTDDKHILVMGDKNDAFVSIATPSIVVYHEPTGDVPTEEYVSEYRHAQEVRPDKTVLRDYNFIKPNVNMETEHEGADPSLEVYDFPGEYREPAVGKNLAKIRWEELRTLYQVGAGKSDCRRFVPGYRYTMDQHARSDFNIEFLLIQVIHYATQPQVMEQEGQQAEGTLYQNDFECIPVANPYRPPRLTPKPTVLGSQTAVVVGPDGEEIHTDEHGRVRVRFHWDRDDRVIKGEDNTDVDKCSCWMRVSQLWAGNNWGAMYIPRIGQEVVVDFLEGDPDQPLVVGRVYHGKNPPPYTLPKDKTKSTIKSDTSLGGKGFNELRFEDAKGKEELYTHAQKDQNEVINNNMSTSVGNDQSITVGNDRELTVKNNRSATIEEGDDKLTVAEGDRMVNVATGDCKTYIESDDKLTVGKGDRLINIETGDHQLTVAKGNHKIEVSKGLSSMEVKKEITIESTSKHIVAEAAEYILLEVKGNFIEIEKDGTITLKGKNIVIKGSESVNISGMSVTSSADNDHNINGVTCKSVAKGPNTIKGLTVMLNP